MFKVGDKVRMIKGKYKNINGRIIDEFMPGWYTVDFPGKAELGINTRTDVRAKEIELIEKLNKEKIMIKLKEGQKVLGEDGNLYEIEKGDLIESVKLNEYFDKTRFKKFITDLFDFNYSLGNSGIDYEISVKEAKAIASDCRNIISLLEEFDLI